MAGYKHSPQVVVPPYDVGRIKDPPNDRPHQWPWRQKLDECNMLDSTTPPRDPRRLGWKGNISPLPN